MKGVKWKETILLAAEGLQIGYKSAFNNFNKNLVQFRLQCIRLFLHRVHLRVINMKLFETERTHTINDICTVLIINSVTFAGFRRDNLASSLTFMPLRSAPIELKSKTSKE